ncbi:NAD-binding protein [Paraliomyxa miuraensis]|uniref:NAD-binding protein n=1 Tax=Paraliomyxa miuraensis TaxID=376150 RepID=UPI002257DF90|nr:NAD-binding protein [Paraliomyxa miuraensis]MCX4243120.1 NAD-binding protein [Paraliomyxa miuraensis]
MSSHRHDPGASGISPLAHQSVSLEGGASGFWGAASFEQSAVFEPRRAPRTATVVAPVVPVERPKRFRIGSLSWRFGLPVLAFMLGVVGFYSGVEVTERGEIADADLLTILYYSLSLFLFGGTDLGTPTGGPMWGRGMLWIAYFLAPAIAASAVIDALLRVLSPERRLARLRDHVVVAGAGQLTTLYLQRLRKADARAAVVVVVPPGSPGTSELRDLYGARVIMGDVASPGILRRLGIERARRVLLLTDDDFTNLDAATQILAEAPHMGPDVVVHVSDLRFLHSMAGTRLARRCQIFNGHQIAASHLVQTSVLDHFRRTTPRDLVILAGFGRFGETVLEELQRGAAGSFDHVVIIDSDAERRALVFEEEVGFTGEYRRDIVSGDLRDPSLWKTLAEEVSLARKEPVFLLGSGVDRTNLRTAMWLAQKYPRGFVMARSEARWTFAEEVSREAGIHTFSVAELVTQSMPTEWFEGR